MKTREQSSPQVKIGAKSRGKVGIFFRDSTFTYSVPHPRSTCAKRAFPSGTNHISSTSSSTTDDSGVSRVRLVNEAQTNRKPIRGVPNLNPRWARQGGTSRGFIVRNVPDTVPSLRIWAKVVVREKYPTLHLIRVTTRLLTARFAAFSLHAVPLMAMTIAILGATGKTGREVLKRFLAKQDVNIRVYVRSRSKLINIFPSVPSNPRVSIFQGPLEDIENMRNCLDGAQKIIFTLGENDNLPGVSVIEDGAKAVLAAIATLRQRKKDWQRPRVILLSSATWNKTFAAARPALVHWAIKTAFIHPYTDLLRGQAVFSDASSLVSVLLVQPSALIEDEPSGHEISVERASLSVTYGDLGAGIVDLACKKEFDALDAVGVSSKAGDNGLKYGPILGYRIIRGLCATYIPWFWSVNQFMNEVISTLTFKRSRI